MDQRRSSSRRSKSLNSNFSLKIPSHPALPNMSPVVTYWGDKEITAEPNPSARCPPVKTTPLPTTLLVTLSPTPPMLPDMSPLVTCQEGQEVTTEPKPSVQCPPENHLSHNPLYQNIAPKNKPKLTSITHNPKYVYKLCSMYAIIYSLSHLVHCTNISLFCSLTRKAMARSSRRVEPSMVEPPLPHQFPPHPPSLSVSSRSCEKKETVKLYVLRARNRCVKANVINKYINNIHYNADRIPNMYVLKINLTLTPIKQNPQKHAIKNPLICPNGNLNLSTVLILFTKSASIQLSAIVSSLQLLRSQNVSVLGPIKAAIPSKALRCLLSLVVKVGHLFRPPIGGPEGKPKLSSINAPE